MMRSLPSCFVVGMLLASLGCSDSDIESNVNKGDGGGGGGSCTLPGVPSACGTTCSASSPCGAGLYCGSDQKCVADCVAGGTTCGSGRSCGANGQCQGMSTNSDGGTNMCPRVNVNTMGLIPTVILLIDQSKSMADNPFGNVSRWVAVKNALTASPNGVLTALEANVRFGATLYSSRNGGPSCPILTEQAAGLNNRTAILNLLNANPPIADTPTGESINGVVQRLKANPPPTGPMAGPTVIVLATDGEPDTCADPNPDTTAGRQAARALSVSAARASYMAGFKLMVLSVGTDTAMTHLQDVANAGAGVASGGANAPFYVANTPAALVTAFDTIIGGTRTCTFTLSGMVKDGGASGDVRLGGTQLKLNDPNGWKLTSPTSIELVGTACTMYKNSANASLTATFGCGTVIE
jgi:hypothetical protein